MEESVKMHMRKHNRTACVSGRGCGERCLEVTDSWTQTCSTVKNAGKGSRRRQTGYFTARNRGFTTSAACTLLRTQMDVATEGLVGMGELGERNWIHFQTQ